MRFGGTILLIASKNILISSKCLPAIIAFMWFVDETQVGIMCATLKQSC